MSSSSINQTSSSGSSSSAPVHGGGRHRNRRSRGNNVSAAAAAAFGGAGGAGSFANARPSSASKAAAGAGSFPLAHNLVVAQGSTPKGPPTTSSPASKAAGSVFGHGEAGGAGSNMQTGGSSFDLGAYLSRELALKQGASAAAPSNQSMAPAQGQGNVQAMPPPDSLPPPEYNEQATTLAWLQNSQKLIEDQMAENASLKRQIDESKAANVRYLDANIALREQLAGLQSEKSNNKDQIGITSLKDQLQALQLEKSKNKSQIEGQLAKINSLLGKIEALKAEQLEKIEELQEQIKGLKSEVSRRQKAVDDLWKEHGEKIKRLEAASKQALASQAEKFAAEKKGIAQKHAEDLRQVKLQFSDQINSMYKQHELRMKEVLQQTTQEALASQAEKFAAEKNGIAQKHSDQMKEVTQANQEVLQKALASRDAAFEQEKNKIVALTRQEMDKMGKESTTQIATAHKIFEHRMHETLQQAEQHNQEVRDLHRVVVESMQSRIDELEKELAFIKKS